VEELAAEPADVLIVDALTPSALSGGEAARVPTVLFMHGPYMFPRDGAPPFGLCLRPARSGLGRLRDRAACAATYAFMRTGMPVLNKARSEYGLPPLASARDLEAAPDRILVCSSPSYDFAPGAVPANVRYVGPQLDDLPMGQWADPWVGGTPLPLVLVSLSSTVMRQEQLLQRAADALGELPVHGMITTGPAVDPGLISAPPNVVVQRWARHADILPHCAAVLTHGGHGTVMKALAAGVPLVVVPLGRDQPDNAARVAMAGVGVRVAKCASAARLRAAIRGVLADDAYGAAAREMAVRLAEEREPGMVIEEIERLARLRASTPGGAR
jgi:MGT family glycosyltransferase